MTAMEKTFAERFAATGDALYAAEKAGYRQPRVRAWENMQDLTIMTSVRDQITAGLDKAATKAPEILLGIMESPKAKDSDKLMAAKIALQERRANAEGDGAEKQAFEMTAYELQEAINQGNLELAALQHLKAERSRPIIEGDNVEIAQAVRNDDDIFQ